MHYLTISVLFSVEYLQANYFYFSIYGVVLAQLFQIFFPLVKNNDFWKNQGKNLWKILVRIDYKHFCGNYLTLCLFISDGKVEFCLASLQLVCVMLYFCHVQVEKNASSPTSLKNFSFSKTEN